MKFQNKQVKPTATANLYKKGHLLIKIFFSFFIFFLFQEESRGEWKDLGEQGFCVKVLPAFIIGYFTCMSLTPKD